MTVLVLDFKALERCNNGCAEGVAILEGCSDCSRSYCIECDSCCRIFSRRPEGDPSIPENRDAFRVLPRNRLALSLACYRRAQALLNLY